MAETLLTANEVYMETPGVCGDLIQIPYCKTALIRHEIRVPAERDDRKDFDLKPAFLKCKQEIREILGA